jgi:hypothetical protein
MRHLIHISLAVLLLAGQAHALTTFTPGTPAKASEVNDNFTELSDRITSLEQRFAVETIAVDCAADASALQIALAEAVAGNAYTVFGTCTGPVVLQTPSVAVQASQAGVDGITLTGSEQTAFSVRAADVTISGLKISLNSTAENPIGVFVGRNAGAALDNLHIIGATHSIAVGRAGWAALTNNQAIDSLLTYDGGFARIEAGNSGFILRQFRSGTVELRDSAVDLELSGIVLRDGSVLVQRSESTLTVNGKLEVNRNASANFTGSLTLSYNPPGTSTEPGVIVSENSHVRFAGDTINAHVLITGSAAVSALNTQFNNPDELDKGSLIKADIGSALYLDGGSSAGAIDIDGNSAATVAFSTLSGVTASWDPNTTYAGYIDLGGQVHFVSSTVNDNMRIDAGAVVQFNNCTINGDIHAWHNGSVTIQGSTVNATTAQDGNCPAAGMGIWLTRGTVLRLQSGNLVNAFVHTDSLSMLISDDTKDFGGSLDATAETISHLTEYDGSLTNIDTCN